MEAPLLWLSFATVALGIPQMAGNFTDSNPSRTLITGFAPSSTLSCEGVSTYDFTPLETVTITVDGEYTYSGNSTPTDIYYTPPPPCSQVIIPSTSSTSEERTPTTSSNNTTTITTTTSSVEPSLITSCSTSYYSSNKTASHGGPYANTTESAVTSCTTLTLYLSLSPALSSAASSSKYGTLPLPDVRTGTLTDDAPGLTSAPFASSFASAPASAPASSSEAHSPGRAITVTVTKKTPVPPTWKEEPTRVGPTFPGGGSDIVTLNTNTGSTSLPPANPTLQPKPSNPGNTNDNSNRPSFPNNGNNNNAQPTGGNNNNNNSPTPGNNNNDRPTPGNNNRPTNGGNNNNNQNQPTGGNDNNNNNNDQNTNNQNQPTGSSNDNDVNEQNNNSPTSGNRNDNSNAPNNNANPTPSGNGLGSIINSMFNSPFSTAVGVATSFGSASATVTLVAGVPVQVGSSSVYIGGSNVALPTGTSTALVTIAGQTFTVRPSLIVAGTSTLTLQRSESISYSAVQAATLAASTVTRNGVTVTVEPTAAVVSGRTFTIGLNAKETTTIVEGQTITFNSNGIVFPGVPTTNRDGVVSTVSATTYRPAITTAAAYVVTTIDRLTFSIDQSEAIISGTTYRIGAGSLNSKTTAVFEGTTVVFGPSGIELPSTTVSPTAPELTDSGDTATSTGVRAATATGAGAVDDKAQATGSGGAGARVSIPSACVSNAVCVVVMLLAAGTLPLSLVL
ncbi:hypothetical protein OHC33_003080 [Knufia fluminis]|uniref:Uncharacterized protein n=1 Tax=Knufia fluminis TaxID=191047 RepID=A0AAN8I5G2_9EURO|nr:hypothetical protein OHC33_003080 [Knufia fluminis]